MKKLLVIILALVLTLSLAACGGNNSGTSTPPANNSSPAPPSSENGSEPTPSGNNGGAAAEDLTTIEGWLAAFGLTESDLVCAHFNRLDINAYVTSTGVITEVGAMVSEQLTDEEVRAWLEQIIAKLESLSDSGQVDNALADGEALTADYIMEQTMYLGAGSYSYGGKGVSVMIAVMPGYLDSDDPDEAMAACSLGLEWK